MFEGIGCVSNVGADVFVGVVINDENSTVYVKNVNSQNLIPVIAPNGDVLVITNERLFFIVNDYQSSISECTKEQAELKAFEERMLEIETEEDRLIITENDREY